MADGAALVYNGALSGNWFDDILGGHYRRQFADKTLPGPVYWPVF